MDQFLSKAAADLLFAAEVDIQLGFMDRDPLAKYCRNVLLNRLQTSGSTLDLADNPNPYKYGLLDLSIEHLTPRLWRVLNPIKIRGILNADHSIFLPEDIRALLQYRIRDWCIADQRHIEAAVDLILGRKPWQGWPNY